MIIQRYLPKEVGLGEYFGEHTMVKTHAGDWYHAEGKIGLRQTEALGIGLLVSELIAKKDETLILVPSKPAIYRDSMRHISVLTGFPGETRNIENLIDLIRGNEVTYLYRTSGGANERGFSILTFSTTEPSVAVYKKGHPLKVRVE